MNVDLAKLGRFIADHFDPDQLRVLCQELGVPYDQLLGDSRSARAFDLVTIARDRGQLSTLLAAVAQVRPEVFDPKDFEVKHQREHAGRRGLGWPTLLGGGVALALLAGFFFLSNRRPASTPLPSATPTSRTQAAATVTSSPAPSPSPTPSPAATPSLTPSSTATPSPTATPSLTPSSTAAPTATPSPAATLSLTPSSTAALSPTPPTTTTPSSTATSSPTPSPTAAPSPTPSHTPSPTATPSPSPTPTPSPTATPSPTPIPLPTRPPLPTPTLSPLSPALTYDAETRTLWLAPGDASLGRARLCTPFYVYHSTQVIYLIESVADSLELPLPGQAYVTHIYPDHLAGGSVTRILEVQRHPVEGVGLLGDVLSFTGCDLLVSEELRGALGFPLTLGEFDDPPRFDHGWVAIEFLVAP